MFVALQLFMPLRVWLNKTAPLLPLKPTIPRNGSAATVASGSVAWWRVLWQPGRIWLVRRVQRLWTGNLWLQLHPLLGCGAASGRVVWTRHQCHAASPGVLCFCSHVRYVGWEDGGAACDSDRRRSCMYIHVTAETEELRFSFFFLLTATTSAEELGVAHYGISSKPNGACGQAYLGPPYHNKRQRLTARNIY